MKTAIAVRTSHKTTVNETHAASCPSLAGPAGGQLWLGDHESRGPNTRLAPAIALHGGIAAVVAALAILAFGYRVRRYQRDAKWVNPMRAALTVSAAQACSLTGALAAGAYLGALGFALGALGSPFMISLRWNTGACALGCLAWMVAGLIVERWCIVDNSDDSSEPGAGATA